MSAASKAAALHAEREALRERLRAGRRLFIGLLRAADPQPEVFPRSLTMRLLLQRPAEPHGNLFAQTALQLLCSHGFRAFVLSSVRALASRVAPHRG